MKHVRIAAMVAGSLPSVVCQSRGSRSKPWPAPGQCRGPGSNRGAAGRRVLNFVNWVATSSLQWGGVAVSRRNRLVCQRSGLLRWIGTALGLLIVSGLTRLLEY